jgi:hypothetical protein
MQGMRHLLLRHRMTAGLMIGLALLLRLLLPQGYMLDADPQSVLRLTVQICHDGTERRSVEITIPMENEGGKAGKSSSGERTPADLHCPYSALGLSATGGADPILLDGLLRFILASVPGWSEAIRPAATAFLWPPMRGPPALF